ncbi:carbohydrate binding protein with CBM6 domain [Flavobacterium sp. 9]|uniref:carbohydrate-binding protein n=1 Tax=Flavobacterium sp. 9 TaxID=2035198 RepID=UPI000C3947F6|nr:carbohydrate-binding protein [Flavobacterium sp. 9]PIF29773.1 carbohydrate binding protein with CBM6 domain [Flavobacterium sp. 9]
MKKTLIILNIFVLIGTSAIAQTSAEKSKPMKLQQIPGKIECEFYDFGGEGIAYHDTDEINNGSGKLNPVNGNPLNEFRIKEAVDISYTKTDSIDDTPYTKVPIKMKQLYVGWTQPTEWINYTVQIKKSGTYKIGVLYIANGHGAISIAVNGNEATGNMKIESTHDDKDPVAWRQWHHWNSSENIGTIKLEKGTQLLTLHIVENGNMNLDYLTFTPN